MLELPFSGPFLNAAGTLGFSPNRHLPFVHNLAAFFTNPISLQPRTPAHGIRLLHFPGGLLVHTGHPNPGLSKTIRLFAAKWRRAELPIIAHLLGEHPGQFYRMVRRLEEVEGIAGVELGMPPDTDADLLHASVQAAIGELPVIVKIGLEQAADLGIEAREAGASGLAIGPPRGMLSHNGQPVAGRLLGAGLFPQMLECLSRMPPGLPVIVGAGIQSPEQVRQALDLGAAGVQFDTALWRLGPIARALSEQEASAR